ncbi:hypothetical protein HHL28_00885 [Aerophototrophica crusticola]|uniref:Uncharacterized protein n=1 Tax=Aerophototrophica crusticola TaxID=1709002 RepID=A0A858R398_9PROT|nr:hypothetical protein HHL28_00885 [Rhodospirillaceae bacterium B3]
MIETLTEAGIIFASIAGLAYLAGLAIAHMVEQTTLRGLKGEGLEGRLLALATLEHRFQARRTAMLPKLVRLEDRLKSARRRHYMVSKRISDMKVSRSRLLRVLGEEEAFVRSERPARKFVAHVINRHVQRAVLDQKEHSHLSKGWNRAQQVIVWAHGIGDAKAMVDKAFPPATGFFVVEIAEPHDGDVLSALEEIDLRAAQPAG